MQVCLMASGSSCILRFETVTSVLELWHRSSTQPAKRACPEVGTGQLKGTSIIKIR